MDLEARSKFLLQSDTPEQEIDTLTGLYKEEAFAQRVDDYISRIDDGHKYAIIFLDVDFYLTLCTKLGKIYAEELMRKIGLTLYAMFSGRAIMSHIRKDEFAIFIGEAPDKEMLDEMLRILCKATCHDMGEEKKVSVSVSLGVVYSNNTELRYEMLSSYGEVTIHKAKHTGGNTFAYYEEDFSGEPFFSSPMTVEEMAEKVKEQTKAKAEENKKHNIFVRTFGYFEVFLDGEPIEFTSKKAKELFALMIDRRGGFISSSEAITYLWDDATNDKTVFARYRKVAMRLKEILNAYGIGDILENSGGYRRIISDKIDCDYYNYLSGKAEFKDLFRGSYMTNYSWAEETLAELWSSHGGGSDIYE